MDAPDRLGEGTRVAGGGDQGDLIHLEGVLAEGSAELPVFHPGRAREALDARRVEHALVAGPLLVDVVLHEALEKLEVDRPELGEKRFLLLVLELIPVLENVLLVRFMDLGDANLIGL